MYCDILGNLIEWMSIEIHSKVNAFHSQSNVHSDYIIKTFVTKIQSLLVIQEGFGMKKTHRQIPISSPTFFSLQKTLSKPHRNMTQQQLAGSEDPKPQIEAGTL